MVEAKWRNLIDKRPEADYSLDKWHGCVSGLRQLLRGWGKNIRGEYKRHRSRLMKEIDLIDQIITAGQASEETTKMRAEAEAELEKLLEAEEIYWQQRGGERWILEGDLNTNFFHHLVANGRRRKKRITTLEHEGGTSQTTRESKKQ